MCGVLVLWHRDDTKLDATNMRMTAHPDPALDRSVGTLASPRQVPPLTQDGLSLRRSVDSGGSRPASAFAPEGCGRVAAVLPVPSSTGLGFSADATGVSLDDVEAPPSLRTIFRLRSDALGMGLKRHGRQRVPAHTAATGSLHRRNQIADLERDATDAAVGDAIRNEYPVADL